MKTDADGTMREYEKVDGDWYCPGCGARYDTPGICEGTLEAKHEPIDVEKVADAGKGDGTGDGATGTLGDLTHDELDALADDEDVSDYPRSGTKPEKVAALEAAGVGVPAAA